MIQTGKASFFRWILTLISLLSHSKKKSGERAEWKYLKCSQYRRTEKYGCVNHVPIQLQSIEFKPFKNGIYTYDARNQEINYETSFLSGILIIRIPFLYEKVYKEKR
ncbi:hypothetical protein BTH38_22185 [Bacillus toyonensis]|nr:hypothetical protein BTH38_22185 [Bacillus toyonensis]